MPLRRLLLSVVLIGLLSTALLTRSGVFAENLNLDYPLGEDGTDESGDWLQIVKSPVTPYVYKGDSAQFSIAVFNTSQNFAMQNVIVSDEQTSACEREIGRLEPSPIGKTTYTCWHEDVQSAFDNVAVVKGINATNSQPDQASATARVEVLDLSVTIEPEPDSIPSPGGSVKFTATLTNHSSVKVVVNELESPEFGNLDDPQNGKVEDNTCPQQVIGRNLSANGGSRSCKFTTNVTGEPGPHEFNITAEGTADGVAPITGSGKTVVTIYEFIKTSLAAEYEKYAPESSIKLKATIKNLSETTAVNILTMEDADLGVLQNCSLPITLAPAPLGVHTCDYENTITAAAGEDQTFTLNVSAETDESASIPLSAQASVKVMVIDPLIFLPVTAKNPRPDSCETARKIGTNISYQDYPDLPKEYYRFILSEEKNVTVKIRNFLSSFGQLALYKYIPGKCDEEEDRLAQNGDFDTNRELETKLLQPGTYYVRVFNGEDLSTREAYSLIVETD